MDVVAYSPYGCPAVSFSGNSGLMTDVEISLPESLTDDILIAGPLRGVTHGPVQLAFRHPLTSISAYFSFGSDNGAIPQGKGVRVVSIGLTKCIRNGIYNAQDDIWTSRELFTYSSRSVSIPVSEGSEVSIGALYSIPFTAMSGTNLRLVWESYNLSTGVTTRRHTIEADLSGRNLAVSQNLNVRASAMWMEDTISFEDPETESVCLAAFDTDGDGVLSYYEADCVKDLGDVFRGNDRIVKFNEFVHFTGIEAMPGRDAGPFANMSSLKEISLPASLLEAGEWPFAHCPSLEKISVDPSNPKYYSLDGCLYSREPESIVRVPEAVGITSFEIPSGITVIDGGCFADNSSIRSLRIGKDVTTIAAEALKFLWLESVSVDPASRNLVVYQKALYETILGQMRALVYLPPFCGIRKIELPSSVTSVESSAFWKNYILSTVVLGERVQSIGSYAFYTTLVSLSVLSPTPPALAADVFLPESDPAYAPYPIYVPASSIDLYRTAPGWSELSSRLAPVP